MKAPVLDVDLYADDVLPDSTALWARIREAGPVVWLPRHRMYAMGRFADVRAALRDDAAYRSGHGVAANPVTNALAKDTTLKSDDDVHSRRRRVLMHSLGAKAISHIEVPLRLEAENLIDDLVRRPHFEAARDFASRLPVGVVSGLVGVRGGSRRMLRWGSASFNALGPVNRRALQAAPRALGLLRYSLGLRAGRVAPGSWAASVFDAQARGELKPREARALVIDFVAPSLDTTILASTHLLWALARHPEGWSELRADPSLIPAAVVENVRLGSPIRGFTRRLAEDREVDGVLLPRGSRVALLFAAANLDENEFPDPERFDLHRANGNHVGWGNGPHTCVGIHLAKLELRSLLEAMLPRVDRIVVGTPTPLRNNTLQGIAALPARFC
jgi:cytochrome P450